MPEGGAVSLLCLAAGSGLPLFCRPPRPQVPFPVAGALHAALLYGAGAGVGLRGAGSRSGCLAWRGFHRSVTLIALSSEPGACERRLGQLLERAFGTMVLVLGLDELVPVRNPERLKRELRRCFPLLDSLLAPAQSLGGGNLPRPPPGPPRDELQERLQRFAAAAGSGPCCLHGGGRALLATPPWRALPPPDAALLGGLLAAGPPGAARDLPVFLPHGSPTVPLRLLVLPLVPGVAALLLCGPRPSLLSAATQLVPQFWSPVLEQLQGCARPPPAPLPPGVLAYLLIDRQQQSTQSGVVPGGAQDSSLPPRRRGAALRRLHALLGPCYFPEDEGGAGPPPARLCYAALPSLTAVALLSPPRLLLLLLPPGAPRSRLRALAWGALRALGGP